MYLSNKTKFLLFVLMTIFFTIIGIITENTPTTYKSFDVENSPEAIITPIIDAPVSDSEIININTNNPNELMRLDGIGEELAKRIIEYRHKKGDFRDIHEIMLVNGIGEKKFEKIKDNICIE